MNEDWHASAQTLSKALPFLRRYANTTIVIKLGGHAMGSDQAMTSFAKDIVLLRHVGLNPLVVHGGGPMIDETLAKFNVESEFINGMRVTDAATIEIVEMVLSGTINKRIVNAICQQGGKAIGLSGKDAAIISCRRAQKELGYVGTPEHIDPTILLGLFDQNIIPVMAPIGVGSAGETLNINGDTSAGALAAAVKASRLLLLTDVPGVHSVDEELFSELSATDVIKLIKRGVISGGMIPKTQTALEARQKGVPAVAILDGRVPHAVLLELFTEHGAGTLIRSDKPSTT